MFFHVVRILLMASGNFINSTVKNPVLPPTDVVGPHGASSKEKAIFAIHPRSSGRGILAFSRKQYGGSYPC